MKRCHIMIAAVLLPFIFCVWCAADDKKEEERRRALEASRDVGGMVRQQWGTPNKIGDNLLKPMTEPGKPLPPLDGNMTKAVDVQLTGKASQAYLTVSAPQADSGDIAHIDITMDLDMDGLTDYRHTLAGPVSGVCLNGFIACDAGTWDNCRYFRWRAIKGSGKLVAVEMDDPGELGGCSCINASCGRGNPTEDTDTILDTLGAGMVAAVQAVAPGFTVSQTKKEDGRIFYYGQDAALDGQSISDSARRTVEIAADEQALKSEGRNQLLAQSADPNSPVSAVRRNFDAKTGDQSLHCGIRRGIHQADTPGAYHVVVRNTCAQKSLKDCALRYVEACDPDGNNCTILMQDFKRTNAQRDPDCLAGPGARICMDGQKAYADTGWAFSGADMWFHVNTVYHCPMRDGIVSRESLSKWDAVAGSVSFRDRQVDYAYKDKDGRIVNASQGVDYDEPDLESSDCHKMCTVRISEPDTQAVGENVTTDFRKERDTVPEFAKPCTMENQCPLEPGETLVKECNCDGNMENAVSILQTMSAAEEDIICSQD